MPVGKRQDSAVNQGKAWRSNSQLEAPDELRWERWGRVDGPKAGLGAFLANSDSPSTWLKNALFVEIASVAMVLRGIERELTGATGREPAISCVTGGVLTN